MSHVSEEQAGNRQFIAQLEAILHYWKLAAGTWNNKNIDPEIANQSYPFQESFDEMVPVVEAWIESVKTELAESL